MKKIFKGCLGCAVALGSMTVAGQVMADDAAVLPEQASVATDTKSESVAAQDAMATKVSEEAFAATRAMQAARVAIYNGQPDQMNQMLAMAMESLEKAASDQSLVDAESGLIPINGSLTLAEDFVPTEANAEFLTKANQYFQNGEQSKGLEQLQLGAIEVSFSRVLIRLDTAQAKLSEAMNLAKQEKYYEVNLALKSFEESLQIDSIQLVQSAKTDKDA